MSAVSDQRSAFSQTSRAGGASRFSVGRNVRGIWARVVPPLALALLSGCQAPQPAWGERTAALNRVHYVHGRQDLPLVYRDLKPGMAAGSSAGELTLLLVHGLASSKASWMAIEPALANGNRLVLVDLPGHGDSAKPEHFDYSMAGQAAVLHEFILERDLRDLVLVGCSYGGGAVLETARLLCLDGDCGRLRGMVLLGAAGCDFPPPADHRLIANPLLRFWTIHLVSPRALAERLLRGVFADDARIPVELLHEYAHVFRDRDAVRAALRAGGEMFFELQARSGTERRYETVECPVLLIWGELDEVVPLDVMHCLADALTHSRTAILADCGHTPQEEQPVETAALISRFLRDLCDRAAGE